MLDRLLTYLGGDTQGPEVWIALALSLLIAILFFRARAHQLRIPRLKAIPNRAAPADCMVVIPARNEEGFIGRAAASLPHDSVLVVDDGSDDRTVEEAEENGAGVIRAGALSRGSFGKSNACIAGARALTSRWILFADADTHYAPLFLEAAIACAEASGVAFLSIYLDQEYASLPEYCLAPYLTALFFCGTNPLADQPLAFNGQCILVRRDAYEFLGGHAAVMTHLNEDVHLAMLARRHRLKFGIARANGLGLVRIRDLGGMVRRGACRFMIGSPVGGMVILIAALAMAAWPPVLWWLASAHDPRPGVAFAVLPFLLLWRWYARGWPSLAALALPVSIYAALPMLVRGLWIALAGGVAEWKGRN